MAVSTVVSSFVVIYYICSVTTKAIQNPNSARVSVPSIISPTTSNSPAAPAFEWRAPLRSTAPYWSGVSFNLRFFTLTLSYTGWFTGLSSRFLNARTARLLVLAGTDRLDKELMIGQMQGKFQLVVVPGVGHMLHEVSRQFSHRRNCILIGPG